MKSFFASADVGLLGLLFFFLFFCGVVVWVFRPGSRGKYQKDARIPLEEVNDE